MAEWHINTGASGVVIDYCGIRAASSCFLCQFNFDERKPSALGFKKLFERFKTKVR